MGGEQFKELRGQDVGNITLIPISPQVNASIKLNYHSILSIF